MTNRSADQLRDVIRDFRRDQIVAVATQLFGSRGTVEVPMDEIASAAGVARSTVYVYFSNRDELLRACLKAMYQRLQEAIAAVFASDARPADRLRAVIGGMLERIDENPSFFRLAVAVHTGLGVAGAEAVDAELMLIGLDMARILEDIVTEGVADGTFHAVAPDRAAALIGQQIFGALSVRSGEPHPQPLPAATEEVSSFVLAALGAPRHEAGALPGRPSRPGGVSPE